MDDYPPGYQTSNLGATNLIEKDIDNLWVYFTSPYLQA